MDETTPNIVYPELTTVQKLKVREAQFTLQQTKEPTTVKNGLGSIVASSLLVAQTAATQNF